MSTDTEVEVGMQSLLLLMATTIYAGQQGRPSGARLSWPQCFAEAILGLKVFIEGRDQIRRLLDEAGVVAQGSPDLIYRPR